MNFSERAVSFTCSGEDLLGIIAVPEQPEATAVVVVVGGPQYRVGSHRQFLLLSRALAEAGYPCMRFDYRGMGDSTGDLRTFEAIDGDIRSAIDAFQVQCPGINQFVLWGLCDAASACLLYCDVSQDARVRGLVLLNPWVRSEATLARAHIKHYYGQRLLQIEFWRKLLTGKLGLGRAAMSFARNLKNSRQESSHGAGEKDPPFQKKMARGLEKFPGRVLLILSENDYTAKEFLEEVQADHVWASALSQTKITRIDIAGADHTFSSADWRGQVEEITRQWLKMKADQ